MRTPSLDRASGSNIVYGYPPLYQSRIEVHAKRRAKRRMMALACGVFLASIAAGICVGFLGRTIVSGIVAVVLALCGGVR